MNSSTIPPQKNIRQYGIEVINLPELSEKHIHVCRIKLPTSDEIFQRLKKSLSTDELLRASNYRFEKDQKQFIVSRGSLRFMLSYYLKTNPDKLVFSYTKHKKPYLENSLLNFNTSHSGDFIVHGFTTQANIGIDIEKINLDLDFFSIGKTVFSEKEYKKFLGVPPNDRPLAFYRLWTRKEAFLKAIGTGLHYPLNDIDVSFLSTEEPKVLGIVLNPNEHDFWKLEEIILESDYIATIATQNIYHELLLYNWHL